MAKLNDFIQQNAKANASFAGIGAAISIAQGEKPLKTMLGVIRDLITATALWKLTMAGTFSAMSKGIRTLLRDTGSLDAALRKLSRIQELHKVFAPLVGGAEAAKKKVAELVNLAASKKIQLGGVAEAAKSLQIMTNGAYSGVQALSDVADAATVTGNSITDVADAVGRFNNTLRGGGSIEGAVDQLKEMNLISKDTADSLVAMKQAGQSNTAIFTALTASLASFKSGAAEAQKSISGVNAEYEAASANLQEKFGSPFVESDIQNTKNMADAMNAIAPAVGRVSQFFASLIGGMGSFSSWLTKTSSQSPVLVATLEGLAKTLGVLVALVSAVSAVGFAGWLIMSTGAVTGLTAGVIALTGATGTLATAIGVLGIAIRGLMILTGIGIVIALITAGVGAYMNFSSAAARASKAVDDFRRANDQATIALNRQINAVKTLTDYHDALAAALANVAKAQDEVKQASEAGDADRLGAAQDNLKRAKSALGRAESMPTKGLAPTEAERGSWINESNRQEALKEQQFQNEMEMASPTRKIELLQARTEDLDKRHAQAKLGADTAVNYSRQGPLADEAVFAAQGRLTNAMAPAGPAIAAQQQRAFDIKNATQVLKEKEAARTRLERSIPAGTSTALDLQASKTQDPHTRAQLQAGAEMQRQREGKASDYEQRRIAAQEELDMLIQENKLTEARVDSEQKVAALRGQGFDRADAELKARRELLEREMQLEQEKGQNADPSRIGGIRAQLDSNKESQVNLNRSRYEEGQATARDLARQKLTLAGDSKGLQGLDDFEAFTNKFSELAPKFGDKTAATAALQFARNSIAISGQNGNLNLTQATAASSLAKIGGGGNIASASGNTLLTVAQRQKQLAEQANIYLKQIAERSQSAGVVKK